MSEKTNETTTYTVGEAADRTGLSVHTLRYYEKAGLIPFIERNGHSANGTKGHRRYSERDLTFIEFLKRLRTTGITIEQMRAYVALVRQGDETHEARREMLAAHRERVQAQIGELQATLALINWKIENYRRLGLEKLAADDACLTTEKGNTNQ